MKWGADTALRSAANFAGGSRVCVSAGSLLGKTTQRHILLASRGGNEFGVEFLAPTRIVLLQPTAQFPRIQAAWGWSTNRWSQPGGVRWVAVLCTPEEPAESCGLQSTGEAAGGFDLQALERRPLSNSGCHMECIPTGRVQGADCS